MNRHSVTVQSPAMKTFSYTSESKTLTPKKLTFTIHILLIFVHLAQMENIMLYYKYSSYVEFI